ncbi:MAG: biopolymer transporter ExbD [Planctomycetota bacterium]|nr:biopolymer transporter ExbD [Planctomycetota bacterium]
MSRSTFSDVGGDGWGGKKKKREDAELDITPMIDVTFLLLIFFILTSTMKGTPDQDVPPAKNGDGVNGSIKVQVNAPESPDDDPVVLLEGREMEIDELITEVGSMVLDMGAPVVIMADRDVPNGTVQDVMKKLRDIEGIRFHIGVQEVKK